MQPWKRFIKEIILKQIDSVEDGGGHKQKPTYPSWQIRILEDGNEIKFKQGLINHEIVCSDLYIEENYNFKQ